MISDERLSEIEALVNAATPGPWKHCNSVYGNKYRYVQVGEDEMYATLEMKPGDARLISASREIVPELVDEVRRLKAQLAEYRGRFNQAQQELLIQRGQQ